MENYNCVALDKLFNTMRVSEEVVDKCLLGAEVNSTRNMASHVFVLVPTVDNHVILSALIQNLR